MGVWDSLPLAVRVPVVLLLWFAVADVALREVLAVLRWMGW